MFDEAEFQRWFKSAKLTLESARNDLVSSSYNWACFKAHQAVEKAFKALLWGLGKPKHGHSLVSLLNELRNLGLNIPTDVVEYSIELSKYYTITRYPDTWESGIPEEYFTEREARDAVLKAEKILKWVEEMWRELSRRE